MTLRPVVRDRSTPRSSNARAPRLRAWIAAAAVAVVAWTAPATAQVSRAGFVPEPSPGLDIVYAAHAFRTGTDVTELRADLWGDRWGFALGAGYLAPGDVTGWSADAVVMREIRRYQNALNQPGVQVQAGLSVSRVDGNVFWEAPASLGVIMLAGPGPLTANPWAAAQVVVRGGDGIGTDVGAGAGAGLRVFMSAGPLTAWGAQLSGGGLRIGGNTESWLEISLLHTL